MVGYSGTMGSPVAIGLLAVGLFHYMLDGSGRYIYHQVSVSYLLLLLP
jgi:hypothetical protein